jgi:hypothetical protein
LKALTFSSLLTAAMLGLWVAHFVKAGFTVEGVIALIAFLLLMTTLHLLAILIKLNTEFFKLSTAAYQHFTQSK